MRGRQFHPPWVDEDLERDTRRENPPGAPLVIEPGESAEEHCDGCGDWFPSSDFAHCFSCEQRYHTEDLHICAAAAGQDDRP